MYDERTNLSAAVAADLRDFYGLQVFQTVIPRNVGWLKRPATASQSSLTTLIQGAEAYSQLAQGRLSMNRKALGRGLGALLSSDRTIDLGSEPSEVDLDSIVPGPMQPAYHFDEAALESLADSIQDSRDRSAPARSASRRTGSSSSPESDVARAAKMAGLRACRARERCPDQGSLEIA